MRALAMLPVLVLATGYRLPPEVPVALGTGESAEMAAAFCSGCHSLDYITRQPRSGAAFWTAEVAKMRSVYGAPMSDEDAARIATYLAERAAGEPQR